MASDFWQWPEPVQLSAPVQYEGPLAVLVQGTGVPLVQHGGTPAVIVPPGGNLTVLVQHEGFLARG